MDTDFWLIIVDNISVTVCLASPSHERHFIKSLGPRLDWNLSDPESLVLASDQSLSRAAAEINLPSDEEPPKAALILPPLWIDNEGKILPVYLKIIERLYRGLKLKPLGYIANDEAITEEANDSEGFPVSFILLYLTPSEYILTLSYLGKVKERISGTYQEDLVAKQVEISLSQLKSDSAIPPEIIIFGHYSSNDVDALKNYSWIGKKDLETFLHFPSIITLSLAETANRYCRIISSQFSPQTDKSIENSSVTKTSQLTPADSLTVSDDDKIIEVSPDEFGFSDLPPPVPSLPVIIEEKSILPPVSKVKTALNMSRLKLKLPPLKIKVGRLAYLLGLTPLLVLIPAIFSRARIIINPTPYEYNQKFKVSVDKNNKVFNYAGKTIPLESKTVDINISAAVQTTEKKTIGEVAHGEIIIYNQHNSPQNLKKGTIFTDESGKKFQLTSSVEVASSNINFDTGTITMGQNRANLESVEIGSEYNLVKDTKLSLIPPDNQIIAKIKDGLIGGNRQQVRAVSAGDKVILEKKLNDQINGSVQSALDKEASVINNYLPGLTEINKQRFEYNREVGEASDELSASVNSRIVVYYLTTKTKEEIISFFLEKEEGFDKTNFNAAKFTVNYSDGTLSITGKYLPKLDEELLKKNLSKKPFSQTLSIVRRFYPRTYDIDIIRNFSFLGNLNPLPIQPNNITIEIKP